MFHFCYSIIRNHVLLPYLQKVHKGHISSSSAWVLWHIEPGPDCLAESPLLFAASASTDPHRKNCAMEKWKRCKPFISQNTKMWKASINLKRKEHCKELSRGRFSKPNVSTHRFKCTRTMGGSFQISSFLVESLWALQCLQNTLLLSVNFSSFEKSLRQSWQREAINKNIKEENFEEKHRPQKTSCGPIAVFHRNSDIWKYCGKAKSWPAGVSFHLMVWNVQDEILFKEKTKHLMRISTFQPYLRGTSRCRYIQD